MNPKYLFCLLTLFLNSCSYAKYTYAPYSKIDPQIHSLYVTHTKNASMDYDRRYDVFNKELDQNIFAQESTPKGILEITQVKYPQEQFSGIGYLILGALTGFAPSLIGVPMMTEEYSPEYDFIIYDIYGNIIANYTITSSKKFPLFIYGFGHKYRIEVLKDIMSQLRNKLKSDAHIINYKLELAEISATESDLQYFNKLIIEYRKGNNSVNRNQLNPTMSGNIDYNNHQIVDNQVTNYGRSKEQITEHIKKLEKIKADCERYLKEENSKEGSSYSPTRAFMWEKQSMDANKQLEQLRAELLRTQH